MASSPLTIIVDDQRTDLVVLSGPSSWASMHDPIWFNGTSQSSSFALNGSGLFGTLQMSFKGTSVAFFGVTPPVFADSQTLLVSIDGSPPYNTSYSDPNPQTYRQWYQSPLLEDGTHNIALSHIAGTSFDFAVITVGNSTPLANEHVIVDNDDPGIIFNGKWRRSQDLFNSGPFPDGFPYHNTTHQTTYAGSSFTYRFSGRSAALYGIFTWSDIGLLTLSFTLDGQTLSQNYRVKADTPQFLSELGQQQNFLFYSYDFLDAGDHTLVVNVTNCVNQTFAFDYITYNPTFSSLQSMPNLTQPFSASPANLGKSSNKIIWGIIGGLAGLVLSVILLGLLFLYFRGRNRKGNYKHINPFLPQQPHVTIIALSNQSIPPLTASSYADTMALMQSNGATENRAGMTYDSLSMGHSHSHISSFTQNTASDTPATAGTDGLNLYHRSSDRNSAQNSIYVEALPPTYAETTRGQPPPTITYIFQR